MMKYLTTFLLSFYTLFGFSNNSVENLIEANVPQKQIPKIIHQIWVGKNDIHPECIKAMETWKRLHPDWEYRLWTDEDIEDFEWTNKELFLSIKNPGAKADVWRYEIINKYGGLYVDVDFICLKPFDLFHENLEFYSGFIGKIGLKTVANGLFASIARHPILQNAIDHLSKFQYSNRRVHNTYITSNTGPGFFTKMIRSYYPEYTKRDLIQKNMYIFNPNVFYPIRPEDWRVLRANNLQIPAYMEPLLEDSYGVHIFARSWINYRKDRPL